MFPVPGNPYQSLNEEKTILLEHGIFSQLTILIVWILVEKLSHQLLTTFIGATAWRNLLLTLVFYIYLAIHQITCPIYCTFPVSRLKSRLKISRDQSDKPSWKKATIEEKTKFNLKLKEKLELSCQIHKDCINVRCKNASHINICDEELTNLLQCVSSAANECLPSSKRIKRNSNLIPNWNIDIEPLKDKAMFWNAVWQSAGRPINTTLHSIMKKSRNVYHFHIRKKKSGQCHET